MVTRVLVDANVLFSRTLRDWLFLLKLKSDGRIFTVSATVDIIAETIARLRDQFPMAEGATLARIHDVIVASLDERVDDFVVDGSFTGRDVGDAHVDAAAKACGAGILLTADKGWERLSSEELAALPYEVHDPDYFYCLIDDMSPASVRLVIADQMEYWLKKEGEVDLPARLRAAGCPHFADRVRHHLMSMDQPRRDGR